MAQSHEGKPQELTSFGILLKERTLLTAMPCILISIFNTTSIITAKLTSSALHLLIVCSQLK